jgi:hypothetical protein
METTLMAAELFAAPAKLSFPHPQQCVEYSTYNFGEFFDGRLPGEVDLFNDKQVIQPSELLHTIYVVAQQQIDNENYQMVLPLCSLLEYLCVHITKSKILLVKARVTKATALIELGYLNEAYFLYRKVLALKDMPNHGTRPSEFTSRADGANFQFDLEDCYHNHLTPEDAKNQNAITFIQKPLQDDFIVKMKAFATPNILEMVQYLRSLFLVRIGEPENVENLDKAEARKAILKVAEESLRASLVNI